MTTPESRDYAEACLRETKARVQAQAKLLEPKIVTGLRLTRSGADAAIVVEFVDPHTGENRSEEWRIWHPALADSPENVADIIVSDLSER